MKQPTLHIIAAALVLGYTGLSFASDNASDNSASVFPAEGNKQCSDYSANGKIIQMGTTSPLVQGTLSGAENPADTDATGESASYTISGGTVAKFVNATTPIDYALLKSGRNISVIIYPSGGVTEDDNMTVKDASTGLSLPISAISLCYGLGNDVAVPPPPEPYVPKKLKSCNLSDFLDQTGVSCPTNGQHTLVCNFELDQPFYGLNNGSDSCCVCNSANNEPLTECNPNIAAGSVDADGLLACPDPASTTKLLATEVTTHFELNNDPYVCSTAGGIRTCFKY